MTDEQSVYLDGRDGLWIPPELREFHRQIVFRTPRATIVHFGSNDLEPYYGLIDETHFGPEEDLLDVRNPELVPDGLTIKREGEDPVRFTVDLSGGDYPPLIADGGRSR